jgi:mono/diheme cytochrome c family protein
MPMPRFVLASVLLTLPLVLQLPATVQAQEKIAGSVEYLNSCSGCHGLDARGTGAVAPYLTVKPPDLTRLSERNRGEFPFLKVFMTIDGRSVVPIHGSRTMPVWGYRYQLEADPNQVTPGVAEIVVRGRVLELVNYLEAIQVGPQRERLLK